MKVKNSLQQPPIPPNRTNTGLSLIDMLGASAYINRVSLRRLSVRNVDQLLLSLLVS